MYAKETQIRELKTLFLIVFNGSIKTELLITYIYYLIF